jgi:hypothetical protein
MQPLRGKAQHTVAILSRKMQQKSTVSEQSNLHDHFILFYSPLSLSSQRRLRGTLDRTSHAGSNRSLLHPRRLRRLFAIK